MNPDDNAYFPSDHTPGRRLLSHLFSTAICIGITAVTGVNTASAAIDPASDWPTWRGPTRDGIAAPGQKPPVQWNETENILWKASIPGRGHGSPTAVGDRVYLATADPALRTQSV